MQSATSYTSTPYMWDLLQVSLGIDIIMWPDRRDQRLLVSLPNDTGSAKKEITKVSNGSSGIWTHDLSIVSWAL